MKIPFDNEDSDLDAAITRALNYLATCDPTSESYSLTTQRLTELYAIKRGQQKLNLELYEFDHKHELELEKIERQDEADARPFYKRVDPNTVAAVVGNLAIGLLVIKYEQTGVISTKIHSFMRKI